MTYSKYLSFGYYELRWPLIIGFIVVGLADFLFADYKENIMIVFALLSSSFLGYQYTAKAPKYRYIANILLSIVVFSTFALLMHIATNFSDLSHILSWSSFSQFNQMILSSVVLTQLGALLYFLHSLWNKFQSNKSV